MFTTTIRRRTTRTLLAGVALVAVATSGLTLGRTANGAAAGVPNIPVPADYTGSGHAEIAQWAPATGKWYVSANNSGSTTETVQYGVSGDIPVPGDYTGTGHADFAVWRPSTGAWYIRGVSSFTYGKSGDVPVPGYYRTFSGNAKTLIPAVWRPSNDTFYVRGVGDYDLTSDLAAYGSPTVHPIALGLKTTIGFETNPCVYWSQADGTLMYLCPTATNGAYAYDTYGLTGDQPTDLRNYQHNNAGTTSHNLAVWRPSNGTWYVENTDQGSPTTYATVQWGQTGDLPLAADYTGDGRSDLAVWRPSNATWYIRGYKTVKYGTAY